MGVVRYVGKEVAISHGQQVYLSAFETHGHPAALRISFEGRYRGFFLGIGTDLPYELPLSRETMQGH